MNPVRITFNSNSNIITPVRIISSSNSTTTFTRIVSGFNSRSITPSSLIIIETPNRPIMNNN
ncbi:hypothetical protein NEUTE1DRAFT_55535 [Neurospora tetrasperma FGSC 2508]|uniref:Uncharacterized protein n=1 Tax=Neurospora tetrasperma (strain FGSC 2508 / ATCC MYA-4615 / P0657) TaxID=510951 RepID=F8MZF8_NEUT8|nr:uncharacterized protein NEUTE1DRAFT_55535 [Neurospora tetrasperma FGSC 2508]EGO52848.1 hypothetical protein NEUTE1DRAFT_55535 [Neurospora tetrasperma FGSC 2508]